MNKRFLVTLVAVFAVLGGIFWFTRQEAGAPEGGENSSQLSEHRTGEGSSGVVLVEYGDFECPACLSYFPVVEKIREKYNNQITFQFRNFPLNQIHPNAVAAHRAAEAAAAQDKFWEMYLLLYQNQTTWAGQYGVSTSQATTMFEGYATQLGLDADKFKQDFAAASTNSIINADKAEGERLGVESTPTFFLDGEKLEDARADETWFSEAIDKAIAQKAQSAQPPQ